MLELTADEIIFTKEEYKTVLDTAADVRDIKKDLATFLKEQTEICGRLTTIEDQHKKEAAVGGFVAIATSRASGIVLFLFAAALSGLDLYTRFRGN